MTPVYTILALIAFAANSLLCRLALGGQAIDAASFTSIRMIAGAVMLLAISSVRTRQPIVHLQRNAPSWRSVAALFAYALAFSFAYVSLTTGTGALILFGAVQSTMLVAALRAGERPRAIEWVALGAALTGLVVLVFPGLTAPPPLGSALMALAGVAWGFYSLWGRGRNDPLAATTMNFVRTVPLALIASALALAARDQPHATVWGAGLATSSGALASGVGYVIWYAALPRLTATRAATVQLAVPVIAAIGGVLLLSETISARLIVSSVMILGGIGLAALTRK